MPGGEEDLPLAKTLDPDSLALLRVPSPRHRALADEDLIPQRFEDTSPAPPPGSLRLEVSQDGLYRLTREYLEQGGWDPSGVDPRYIHVMSRGVELPILVEGEEDGAFDEGDAVLFYGQELAIRERDLWNGGDFTDTNVYWLYADSTGGNRMEMVNAAPVHGYPPVSQVTATVRAETNNFFDPTDHFRPLRDLWYWLPYYGGSAGASASHAVEVPHPVPGSSASVTATAAGFGSATHGVSLALNGAAPLEGPATWVGASLLTSTWTFPAGLVPGTNTVTFSTTGTDYQIADAFDLTYQRTLEADAGELLLACKAVAGRYVCSGFTAKNPLLLDLTATDSGTGLAVPARLVGGQYSNPAGTATFELGAAAGPRRVGLFGVSRIPDSAAVSPVRDLADRNTEADLLVITHPDFHPEGDDPEWQAHLARRGSSMEVEVVDIQEVYDRFSFGIFDPTAIRSFLKATRSWAVPPIHVLLIGDGTYDYKDYLNRKAVEPTYKNWVPTMLIENLGDYTYYGKYSTDAWFGDTNSDGYPEMAVGRIPARSYSDLAGVLQKIAAYEDQSLQGTWYKSAYYVGDTWRQEWERIAFEGFNDYLQATYTGPPWTNLHTYFHDPPWNGTDGNACAAEIRDRFPQAGILHYSGHGGINFWGYSEEIFTNFKIRNGGTASDVDLLPASPSMPFIVNGNCYVSSFDETYGPCLMEDALSRSDRGPAGSIGPTTIEYVDEEAAFAEALFQEAFGRSKSRSFGNLVEAGRFALPSTNTRAVMSLALLGDPSMRLRMPAPDPPLHLSGATANTRIMLSWGAPGTPAAGYWLYRSNDGGTTWGRRNGTLLSPSQLVWEDYGLVNQQTYQYYLTSQDVEGFEGPPSNMVALVPSNPAPPSVPTGLTVLDAGLETVLSLSWNANPEADLAEYRLYWGTAPGAYTGSEAYPKSATSAQLSGLETGRAYYFALSAANTSGRESARCAERSGTPTGLRLAVRPPAMIADLRVTRAGSDLVLHWSKPTLDLGGQPVEVSGYTVYRVQGRYDWSLDKVGTYSAFDKKVNLGGGDATTYSDPSAALLPDPVTYLVAALAKGGVRSPVSNPPPAPILTLTVTKDASGATLLSFPPVTGTVSGTPATIAGYTLMGFFPMTASSDHVAPPGSRITPPFPVTLPPALPTCSGNAVYCYTGQDAPLFYTVIAVDNRGNTSLY